VLHILSVYLCVCSLSYPACKEHAVYYIVICALSRSAIFLHIFFINGTIFGNWILNIKFVLILSTNLSKAFLFLRGILRDITNVKSLHVKYL
jgi:hypothetical protein